MPVNENTVSLNSRKHSRSVSENAVFTNNKKVSSNAENNNNNDDLPSMQELSHSSSHPSHKKQNLSTASIKSSASSGSASHHSSISSVSEQKENLNPVSSASPTPTPTPTHQHNTSNHSFSMEEIIHHSDSDEYYLPPNETGNQSLRPEIKRHRRSSSGKTYGVTKTGHLDIPSKVPESGK